MEFITVGINHKSAPIELREKLYLNSMQQDLLLSELKSDPRILEACVLSTCHRIEVYAYVLDGEQDFIKIINLIFHTKNVAVDPGSYQYFYQHSGKQAVAHILEVATGLDSLVLGENQILGQVKLAFDRSQNLNMFGRQFNILSNIAIRTGKKARHETKINYGGSSISWAAIVKAEEVLGNLKDCSALVIGAGQMSEIAVGHIQNRKFKKFFLMNRTQANAQSLAKKYGGEVVSFYNMKDVLKKVDVCICSAGAPHYLLEKDVVEHVMPLRDGRQLIIIDISMPRNIDPRIEEVKNVLLYQIDDLNKVVSSNMKVREKAIEEVYAIINEKIVECDRKLKKLPRIEASLQSNPDPIA